MKYSLLKNFDFNYMKKSIDLFKIIHEKVSSVYHGSNQIEKGLVILTLVAMLSWLSVFLTVFIVGISSYFSGVVSLDTFGKIGDSFNIATSLFTAFTVCLVAYTIYQQKVEFEALKKHTREEAATDRAIKLIEEWKDTAVIRGGHALSSEQHRFIERLFFMKNPKFKDRVDLALISEFLIEEGVVLELELECVRLDKEIKRFNKKMKSEDYIGEQIKSKLAMIKIKKDTDDLIPPYLRGNEYDVEDLEPESDNCDIRDYVISSIEDSIRDCEDKKNKYKEIIRFLENKLNSEDIR